MADDRVECLNCGRSVRSLGLHLAMAHGTAGADNLAAHGLPPDTPLIAESLRQWLSQRRSSLDPARAEAASRARRAAGIRTVASAQRARCDATETRAQAAGHASMTEAIQQTRHLTISAAAARIGVGLRTITLWRHDTR